MVANYNDLLRKQISECFNNNEDTDSILGFFYNLNNDEQQIIIRLALSDIYKLSYYIDGKPSELFKYPIQDVIDKCITDVGLVIDLMLSSKLFNDMDYVSKTLLLETMEENDQDKNIISIYKLHILDKFTYIIVDDIENYKKYYKEYLDVNKDKPNKISTITEYISYRILNLKYEDTTKYKKYILEFIKVFYKWKNFIQNHEGKYLLNKSDIIYLDIINSKSLLEIFEYIENDFDFLFTIVGDYLHYKTQKIEIKEEIVDEYLISSSSEKLKQKLKIKEN
jgi:hypothetical protein